jgi:hypothetical protein
MAKVNRTDVGPKIARTSGMRDSSRLLVQNRALDKTVNIASNEKLQRLEKARAGQLRQAYRLDWRLSHLDFITQSSDVPTLRDKARNYLNQACHRRAAFSHKWIHPQNWFLFLAKSSLEEIDSPVSAIPMNAFDPVGLNSRIRETFRICLAQDDMIDDSES